MKELLHKYGLAARPSLELRAAERKTETTTPRQVLTFPMVGGLPTYERRKLRRRVIDLVNLSESAMPSRAIRLIRNGISALQYGLQPRDVKAKGKTRKYEKAKDLIRSVLDAPNATDDDFQSFLGQIVEDVLIFDAGVWEYVEKPKYISKNEYLALEVVPGYTIARNIKWKGDPKMPRWVQVLDDGSIKSKLLDSQIEYVMHRKRSFDPFGLSPLETALEIMDALINLSSYQRQIASEAYPSIMMYLGDDADDSQVKAFKYYWANELTGRGTPGFFGGMGTVPPTILPLKPNGDDGLFLQYHALLTRVLATCFDLHPMDFGEERDVNRSTAEVTSIATAREAVAPLAQLIRTKVNAHVLPRIAELSGEKSVNEMELFWTNLSPEDELRQSQIDGAYAMQDAITLDEMRANLDLDPLPNGLGKMTITAFRAVVGLDPTIMLEPEGTDILEKLGQAMQPPPGMGAPGEAPGGEMGEWPPAEEAGLPPEQMPVAAARLDDLALELTALAKAMAVARNGGASRVQ